MMKKVLRCLAVAAVVAGCMVVALSERGNQQENTMENNSAECRYYEPTEDELNFLYGMTYAIAGDEEAIIQTMIINVGINRAKIAEQNLIEIFTNQFQLPVIRDGVPYTCVMEGKMVNWVPVTEDMLTDQLKENVDLAFEQDYTNGALHCCNIYLNYSKVPMPEEFIQEGDWIFY